MLSNAEVNHIYGKLGSIEATQEQILAQTTKTNGHVREHGELLAKIGEWMEHSEKQIEAIAEKVGEQQTYQDQQRGGAQRLAVIWTAAVSILSAGIGAVVSWLVSPHKG